MTTKLTLTFFGGDESMILQNSASADLDTSSRPPASHLIHPSRKVLMPKKDHVRDDHIRDDRARHDTGRRAQRNKQRVRDDRQVSCIFSEAASCLFSSS